MYAIMHTRTKQFVYGTDYRCNPHKQLTDWKRLLSFEDEQDARFAFKHRMWGKSYAVVEIEPNYKIIGEPITHKEIVK